MIDIEPQSVQAIAKKDFQDAVRSWMFWALSFFFFAVLSFVTILLWYFVGEDIVAAELTTTFLIEIVSNVTRVLIPIIALLLGWKAIAGERASGSMKILLSLPHSRTDVIIGKLLGRMLVLSLSLVIGFSLAGIVVLVFTGGFGVDQYIGLLAMSILYGLAYLSIGVTISALTKSTTIAGIGIFAVFILFYVVWNLISTIIWVLAATGTIEGTEWTVEVNDGVTTIVGPPAWGLFFDMIDPGNAYVQAINAVSSAEMDFLGGADAAQFGDQLPWFLNEWVALTMLVAWIVVPTAIAVFRFNRVDL